MMRRSRQISERPRPAAPAAPSLPPSLRREALGVVLGVLFLEGALYLALRPVWSFAGRWLALSSAVSLLLLAWLLRALEDNRRSAGEAVLASLGWGTRLTIVRSMALATTAGFLFAPEPARPLAWLPALAYTVTAALDYLDGWVARRQGRETLLGARLDLAVDSLGMLIAVGLAVQWERLGRWYLLVGLARWIYVAALWARRRRGLEVRPLPPSRSRRLVAGFQMGFVAGALWPIAPAAAAGVAGWVFALPTLGLFLRDWLAASRHLDTEASWYRRSRRRVAQVMTGPLPLAARLLLAAGLAWQLGHGVGDGMRDAVLADWAWPLDSRGLLLLAAAFAFTSLAGLATRVAGLLALVAAAVEVAAHGLGGDSRLLLVAAGLALLLGAGRYGVSGLRARMSS